MDEKKERAILKATRKLLGSKTPEEDIIISIKELGLSEEEAKQFLEKAKSGKGDEGFSLETGVEKEKPGISPQSKKTAQAPAKDYEVKPNDFLNSFGPEKNEEISESVKDEPAAEEKKEDGISFFSRMLGRKGNGEKTAPEKEGAPKQEGAAGKKETAKREKKTFIPKLKKGGREKVKEIFPESPLGREAQAKKTPRAESGASRTSALDALVSGGKAPAGGAAPQEKKPRAASEKPIAGETAGKVQAPAKPVRKSLPENGLAGKTSLDILEKKMSEGKGLGEAFSALESMPKKTVPNAPAKRGSAKVTILVIPNKQYSQGMETLVKSIGSVEGKLIYVNLNELYNNLLSRLGEIGADLKKFYFVDAITLTSDKNATKHENVIFVSSPNSLIELSLAITQAINTQKPKAFVFDSLSTLLIYEKETTVTKFVHSLIGKIKANGIDAYFTALEGDSRNEAIKDLGMFVDRVLTMTEFELAEMGVPTGSFSMSLGKSAPEKAPQKGARVESKFPAIEDGQGKIIREEMESLKSRLQELQSNQEVTKSLSELKGKIGKMQNLESLEGQIRKIYEKIDAKKQAPIDSAVLKQISRLEEKIDFVQKRKSVDEDSRVSREVRDAMKDLREKVGKIEKLSGLESQVREISKAVEERKREPIDSGLVKQITKLELKIDGLEKKLSEKKKKAEKGPPKEKPLRNRLEEFRKQLELEKMMDEMYSVDVSKVNPNRVATKQFEKKLSRKEAILENAFKKGVVSKKYYAKGKSRIRKETRRLRHAAEVNSLEKKLAALNEAYDSGIISKESYFKGKARLERLLKN